jgi:hypothetical protein
LNLPIYRVIYQYGGHHPAKMLTATTAVKYLTF